MIVHTVDQGSPEWFELRKGKPTGSEFSKIMSAKQMKRSKSFEAYAARLASELCGEPQPQGFFSDDMQNGKDMEPLAISMYEFDTGQVVDSVGFIYNERYGCGASPDGIVLGKGGVPVGGVEAKCPKKSVQLVTAMKPEVPAKHLSQIYGEMLVAELDWVDFVSFHPECDIFIKRVHRDETFGKWEEKFQPLVDEFNELVAKLVEQIGPYQTRLEAAGIDLTLEAPF